MSFQKTNELSEGRGGGRGGAGREGGWRREGRGGQVESETEGQTGLDTDQ